MQGILILDKENDFSRTWDFNESGMDRASSPMSLRTKCRTSHKISCCVGRVEISKEKPKHASRPTCWDMATISLRIILCVLLICWL